MYIYTRGYWYFRYSSFFAQTSLIKLVYALYAAAGEPVSLRAKSLCISNRAGRGEKVSRMQVSARASLSPPALNSFNKKHLCARVYNLTKRSTYMYTHTCNVDMCVCSSSPTLCGSNQSGPENSPLFEAHKAM